MSERTRPMISVVVPVYDVEAYLPACLDSILEQTFEDFEVVVVNDGSTDGSQAIIDRYAASDGDRVRAFVKPNGGLGDARNFGIEHSRGDYLAFVDSDDTIEPTMLEEMLARVRETGAEMVICGIRRFADGEPDSPYLPEPDISAFGHSLAERPDLLFRVDASACDKLYARVLLDRTGARFPRDIVFEDVPTVFVLAACANRIEKIDEPLYRYRRDRAGSITGGHGERHLELVEAFRRLDERLAASDMCGAATDDALLRLHLTHLIAGRYPDFLLLADGVDRAAFLGAAFELIDARFPGWRDSAVCGELWPNALLRRISTHRSLLVAFCRMPRRIYLSALRRMGAFDPLR
ncbi:MAG: glycosyltransferase [Actinobacteria bacterium]|nr:MAG: glycosyltransferase [Actinomycetota bacterium]